ncbi:MAG: hypothetical protein Q4B54_00115 [Coriobacteriales bacterium]|nr:hypothetical protein [Coriobacteriales bacterium]
MLHRDYLLDVIEQFVSSVSRSLARALLQRDMDAAEEVEAAIADLVQLDPNTAMALAPESLVTMMMLSGTGDAVAGYAAYALNKLGDAYDRMNQPELADMRREQAAAIANTFGANVNEIPEELRELDESLRA